MLRVRLLGELELEADGEPLTPPAGRPARAVLGWLALHPGSHARAAVAGRLWPGVLDASARKSLRTALSSLRAALGPAGAEALVATRETIELAEKPAVWVDARAFAALVAGGRHGEALALCRGEVLAGLDDDWVLALRDEHRRRQGEVLDALADAAARAGDDQRAVQLARTRVALDPLDEGAQRELMRRLAAAGDRAGALRAYAGLADRLRRELAVAPSNETRTLAEALRSGEVIPTGMPAELRRGRLRSHPAPALPTRLAATRRPTPLVGRDAQLARLRELWERVRSGERRVALLTGEPGIGKTRLATELAREVHGPQVAVLYGRAEEDSLAPYQPFVEALRDALARDAGPKRPAVGLAEILPELRGRPPEEAGDGEGHATAWLRDAAGARLRLFDAVATALDAVSRHSRLLLVLDDLHWADAPTLRLLVHVAGRSRLPALFVVACRDTDMAGDHPLRSALADLRRELAVEHVALGALATSHVARLLQRAGGPAPDADVVRAVHDRTGGNPYFIEELLHGLGERELAELAHDRAAVPDGVADAVARRIGRLGPRARAVLTAGAVAGPEFDLDLAAQVAGLPTDAALDALDAAVRARLLDELDPGRYAFVHALAREALTRHLTATRAARLHQLIAAALEPRAAKDPERWLGPLAHHALEAAAAGDPDRAVQLAERAAARASAVHAHEDAARLLERALDVLALRGGPSRRSARLLCALGEARLRAGATESARAALHRASELARTLGDRELLARAALGAGGIGVTILRVDRVLVERLEEALAVLGDEHDGLRARLLARLAVELAYDPDERRREQLSREAVDRARRVGDEGALAAALGARHVALWGPDHVRARLACAAEMLDVARRAGDRELALQARNWRVVDLLELGDGPAVRAELDAYAALAADVRLPAFSWYVPVWRATLALLDGRVEDAMRLGRRAREQGRRAGDANADVFWEELRHTRQIADDRFDEDEDLLRYIEDRAARSPAGLAYRATLAWTYAELGREADARRLLDAVAADAFSRIRRDMNWLPALASATQATAVLGDAERARTLFRLLEPYRDLVSVSGRGSGHYGSVAYLLARLAATLDDVETADELYAEATRRDEQFGALVWVVRDLRHHGELLLRHGRTGRAHELLLRAERGARRAGLERVLAAVRRGLATLA